MYQQGGRFGNCLLALALQRMDARRDHRLKLAMLAASDEQQQ
jgi:hypothetical protein